MLALGVHLAVASATSACMILFYQLHSNRELHDIWSAGSRLCCVLFDGWAGAHHSWTNGHDVALATVPEELVHCLLYRNSSIGFSGGNVFRFNNRTRGANILADSKWKLRMILLTYLLQSYSKRVLKFQGNRLLIREEEIFEVVWIVSSSHRFRT
jgi:hypothetical protein